ncbi:MCE family protein [Actinophytocola oryzae]|uniref:Phospholipid/cholesterol/gamma-HCH transport system substrate-binding protein n=1 Tax=Actinophytocola oryzae TaxID=502181 RepID=A0A4R7UZ01_9PSEU|nr:MCE family protein [Actinophytocola oryzae]TDV41387.1 phospholipid/cholesterol/gamma-HCH transport system substrate-binding protein [Actinophytocola oryzae]
MRSFKERNPVPIGVIGTVVLLGITALVYFWGDLPGISGTTYEAEFSEAAGLRADDEVRVAGIKVGEIKDVELDSEHGYSRVLVTFRVDDTWIGDHTTAAIKIKTLLGRKFLALHPTGDEEQDPDTRIGLDRTATPYDVTQAFEGLADTVGDIDTGQLADSFRTISDTFADSPEHVRSALDGLTSLSHTISSRDTQLAQLLANTRQITTTLSGTNSEFDKLLDDGKLLLDELNNRRDAIHKLLTGTTDLARQLSGLVADNQKQLGPALAQLDQVTDVLTKYGTQLDRSLQLAGPYFRTLTNITGSGQWLDTYVCGLVPENREPCMPKRPSGGAK